MKPSIELLEEGLRHRLYLAATEEDAREFSRIVGAQSITQYQGRIEILVLTSNGY